MLRQKRGETKMNEQMTQEAFWKDAKHYLITKNTHQASTTAADAITLFDYFATMKDNDQIWHYEKGIYKPVGESTIKEILNNCEHLNGFLSKHFVSEVVAKVKWNTYMEREDFEAPQNLICLGNGIFDLNEKELIPHSHEYYFKSKINVNYKEDADCPAIKKFVSEIVEDKHYNTAFEIIAYMMYRTHFIQKAFMLSGDGDNGKSRYIDLIETFIGKENLSYEELQNLCHNTFSKAELYGKLGNLCADLPATIMKNSGDFKKLTGFDTISAQKKFGQPFSFKSYAKMVFSANEVPETKDNTDAFYKRWEIIEFPFKFKSNLPEEKYTENIRKADKNILDKITTKKELEGLLKINIDLLIKMIEKQDFTYVTPLEEIKIKYNLKSNSHVVFVETYLSDENPDDSDDEPYVQKEFLLQEYHDFCKKMHTAPKTDTTFFKMVKERWNVPTEKKTIDLGKRKNCFVGISYNPSWREECQ